MAGFTKEFMELHSYAWLILFKAAPLLFPLPKIQLFTVFQSTSAALYLVFTECQKIQEGIVYSGLMHFSCTFSEYIYSLRRNAKAKSASTAAENSYVHFQGIVYVPYKIFCVSWTSNHQFMYWK